MRYQIERSIESRRKHTSHYRSMVKTYAGLHLPFTLTDVPHKVFFRKGTELMDKRNVLVRARAITAVLACLVTERRRSRIEGFSLSYITIRLEINSQQNPVIYLTALLEKGSSQFGKCIHFPAINLIMTDVRAWKEYCIMIGILASEVGDLIAFCIKDMLSFEVTQDSSIGGGHGVGSRCRTIGRFKETLLVGIIARKDISHVL